jgi:hypothetical protein
MVLLVGAWPSPLRGTHSPPDLFGGPEVGDPAPPLILKDLQGRQVRLEGLKRPLVLVTGSYSCPIYRKHQPALERLYEKYGDRADFFILYTVEAHPAGSPSPYADREWVTEENRRAGILLKAPSSYKERVALASQCRTNLRVGVPILIDEMDNSGWERFGKAPNAAYLIDSKGKVRFRQGWFDPVNLERALLMVLQEEPPSW